uniref:hypothetical protein n=1 Tax=Streptomyces anulatus TaxID=1892 RepID=UPI003B22708D
MPAELLADQDGAGQAVQPAAPGHPPADHDVGGTHETDLDPRLRPHPRLVPGREPLLKAAGVASVDLVAHRDTWEWLTALAVDYDHFRTPLSVEDVKEGRVQCVLSGRSLIGLLIKLWDTRHAATPLEADWALAMTAYTASPPN